MFKLLAHLLKINFLNAKVFFLYAVKTAFIIYVQYTYILQDINVLIL